MPFDIDGTPYDRFQREQERKHDRDTTIFLVGLFIGLLFAYII